MSKEDMIELEGIVKEALPNTTFLVISAAATPSWLTSPESSG